jgi:hypothetical protein
MENFDKTTLYKILVVVNNFIAINDTIYINKEGAKYVITKYGFRPVEEYNLQEQIKEQKKQIVALTNKNKDLEKKYTGQKTQNATLTLINKKISKANKESYSRKKCECGSYIAKDEY